MVVYIIPSARNAALGGNVTPVAPAGSFSAPARERSLFGEAYVRETLARGTETWAPYGPAGLSASPGSRGGRADGREEPDADDKALLAKLQARDAKVRAHEARHVMAAGGQAAGAPTYTYQTGPDGQRYAIGGSVNISMRTTGDPEADARQARTARRAALATGEPSARDMQTAMRATSRAALAKQRALEQYAQEEAQALPVASIVV